MNNLNITWEKCIHGIEKRSYIPCEKCREEKEGYLKRAASNVSKQTERIPIKRGCPNKDGCFCTGYCEEIIGYRDALPGENKITEKR